MKTDIFITISARVGQGKTTLASALTRLCCEAGAFVENEDYDYLSTNEELDKKKLAALQGKKIKIVTKQLRRNKNGKSKVR